MTKKLKAHYKRLQRNLREEGLWNWRKVALALHEAGLALQTGTVPVERLWAVLDQFLPAGARRIGKVWFTFLADLMFLRCAYLHFNGRVLPAWSRDDSLMASQVDSLLQIAKELQAEPSHQEPLILQALSDVYSRLLHQPGCLG